MTRFAKKTSTVEGVSSTLSRSALCMEVFMNTKNKALTQDQIMNLLDKLYSQAIDGIPKVSLPIKDMANDYLQKYPCIKEAAKACIRYQIAKCTTSGFLAGLGGLIVLPVAVPANIGSVMYVQIRMIACIAYMGGYDVNCDQVQTLVYACLAGVAIDNVIKKVGIEFGNKFAMAMVKKIPGEVLVKINQKVGFRFITKLGSKGLINIGKAVPVVGGIIGGGFDFAETKVIANRAYKMFILNDFSSSSEDKPD